MKSIRWRAIGKAEMKRAIKKECYECGCVFYILDEDEDKECCSESCHMHMVGMSWSDFV